jgi:hypothetical protein
MVWSGELRAVRPRGMHGVILRRLGISLIAISISKDQPLHIREHRKRLGNRHVVTVHGHLEEETSCAKKARVPILVTEGIIAISRHHRIRSLYCFSPEVNDGKSGWLKPPFIH